MAIQLAQDLRSYFEAQIRETASKQGLVLSPFVHEYLSRMLARFVDPQNYLDGDKREYPVLALLWLEGVSTPDLKKQIFQLQYLGDVALFTSGFFGERVLRSAVDMDYYMALGGSAYERVGQLRENLVAERMLNVFFELSERFAALVEVFGELSDRSKLGSDAELLKLYERWLKGGPDRLGRLLAERGVIPAKGPAGGGRN